MKTDEETHEKERGRRQWIRKEKTIKVRSRNAINKHVGKTEGENDKRKAFENTRTIQRK